MTVIEAIFEKGVFRPVSPLELTEGLHVEVLVPSPAVDSAPRYGATRRKSAGILPDQDAQEMLRIIAEEFEQVNPDEWR